MFLGTSRWLWILSGLLVLLGFVGLATGQRPIGLLLLVVGLTVFAVAPTGPNRRGRGTAPEATSAASVPHPTALSPSVPPAAPAPRRKPLDIEAGDPSQV